MALKTALGDERSQQRAYRSLTLSKEALGTVERWRDERAPARLLCRAGAAQPVPLIA